MKVKQLFTRFIFAGALLSIVPAVWATDLYKEGAKYVSGRIVSDVLNLQTARSGHTALIGVLLKIEPGWHIYWENSGESGLPTALHWNVPESWNVSDVYWPVPYLFNEAGGILTYGYKDEVLLWSKLFDPQLDKKEATRIDIKASVKFLACKDKCIPGKLNLAREFLYSSQSELAPSIELPLFEATRQSTPTEEVVLKDGAYQLNPLLAKIVSQDPESSEELFILSFQLPSRIPSSEIGQRIQLFPRPLEGYTFRHALLGQQVEEVVEESGNGHVEKRYRYKVLLAANLTGNPPKSLNGFSVVLALAPDVFNKSATPIPAQGPIVIPFAGQTIHKDKRELENLYQDSALLGYRVVSSEHLGDKDGDASLAGPFVEEKKGAAAEKETVPEDLQEELTDSSPDLDQEAEVSLPEMTDWSGEGSLDKSQSIGQLLWILILAVVAGFILNFMPCVLPVVSLKLFSLVQLREHDRREVLITTAFYTLGIISSLVVLALFVVSLRSVGRLAGWGFQFQSPSYVAILALVMFFLALWLLDFFSLHLVDFSRLLAVVEGHSVSRIKHFLEGVLAVMLSTPCTAPFLGAVLAFAFAMPGWITVLVFAGVGVGLSLPYIFLAICPRALSVLPRPGNWMSVVRQFMAFPLFGTSIWLLFILQELTGRGALWLLVLMLLLVVVFWLTNNLFAKAQNPLLWRMLSGALFASLLFYVLWGKVTTVVSEVQLPVEEGVWSNYQPELWPELLNSKERLFVDFTAEWCITCKANEALVLSSPEVSEAFSRCGVSGVKVDWTRGGAAETELLKSFGGTGVPYYVFIKPGRAGYRVLPTVLTKGLVIEAICSE